MSTTSPEYYEVKCKRNPLFGWDYYVAVKGHDIEDYPKKYSSYDKAQEMADYYNELREAAGDTMLIKTEPTKIHPYCNNKTMFVAWDGDNEESGSAFGETKEEAVMNLLEKLYA